MLNSTNSLYALSNSIDDIKNEYAQVYQNDNANSLDFTPFIPDYFLMNSATFTTNGDFSLYQQDNALIYYTGAEAATYQFSISVSVQPLTVIPDAATLTIYLGLWTDLNPTVITVPQSVKIDALQFDGATGLYNNIASSFILELQPNSYFNIYAFLGTVSVGTFSVLLSNINLSLFKLLS